MGKATPFSPEEIKVIFTNPKAFLGVLALRNELWCRLLHITGLRESEGLSVRVSQVAKFEPVNAERTNINDVEVLTHLKLPKEVMKKGVERPAIALSPKLRQAIKNWIVYTRSQPLRRAAAGVKKVMGELCKDDFLFRSDAHGQKAKTSQWGVSKGCIKANIEKKRKREETAAAAGALRPTEKKQKTTTDVFAKPETLLQVAKITEEKRKKEAKSKQKRANQQVIDAHKEQASRRSRIDPDSVQTDEDGTVIEAKHNKGMAVNRCAMAKVIKDMCRRVGISPIGKCNHSFRKSLALETYEKTGKDIIRTRNILGQKSIASTQYYLDNSILETDKDRGLITEY
jgi:site-specific recombinase XerD